MEKIPEKNTLPLNITENETLAKSGASAVWSVKVKNAEGQERDLALKGAHKKEFADDAEMQKSKEFYDYIKNFPEFGHFIPETLYFKARPTEGEAVQSYSLQRLVEGSTVDRMSDEEIYADPELVKELIVFARAAANILRATRGGEGSKPDFGTSYDASAKAIFQGNILQNPRYTRNILIAKEPDEHGQRVWFVDTGQNPDERANAVIEKVYRHTAGRGQELQLERWADQLERHLAK